MSSAFAFATTARAQQPTSTEETIAASLFQQGRELMGAGKIEEACGKLQESERLVAAAGTLLNLAVCHERMNRTATAWGEFRLSLAWARRDGRSDRVALAEEHLAALEPHLPKLVLAVSPDAGTAVHVEVDGTTVGPGAWGTPFAVDPGRHAIAASQPGRAPWRTEVTVTADARVQTVSIPQLTEAPAPATPPEPPAVGQPEMGATLTPTESPPRSNLASTRRIAAIAVAGAGVVELGLGAYFGVRAFSLRSTSDGQCNPQCTTQGVSSNDAAIRSADASTTLLTVGLLTLGAGAYLWLTGARSTTAAELTVVPMVGGLATAGRF